MGMGVWVYGCMGMCVWVYGCMGMGVWVYGYRCMGVRMYGYGCMGVCALNPLYIMCTCPAGPPLRTAACGSGMPATGGSARGSRTGPASGQWSQVSINGNT
jgi:hypothetical protein